ncbi:glycosyltransferase family 4 protein [Hoeflea sp. WL0058]|uniref:Glycosyltransferase family 4 protein n=1 Tax=Flavimaribacter sediminis TaxID=2865987 RepID=A0AAE3D0A6_9HYPH|nr:glycosyltransferase family 4 protein [Flavimaribacter sediminis]MBW8636832.1 glycosyltransferase family 4 protein [Flavimaribacter sediminis]
MIQKIAFYAPLKSPNDPHPSGDREIARLLMRALAKAGFDVTLASQVKSYQKRADPDLYARRYNEVEVEKARIRESWLQDPQMRPDLWFTYHPYCKSPDWLGPYFSREFGVPYATAEAARTAQDSDADWEKGRLATREAVKAAAINFVLKDSDWAYLESFMPDMRSAKRLAPFLDLSVQPDKARQCPSLFENDDPVLMTAGMMRPGKKLQCYESLAASLLAIGHDRWNLVVAGDGPERDTIEELLSFIAPERLKLLGNVEHQMMFDLMDRSDIFVWPGIREPIGMVYLEAQSRGAPVVALDNVGVPAVVDNGQTGLLAKDNQGMAAALRRLLADPSLRRSLGNAGAAYVRERHDVAAAATTLGKAIRDLG